MSSGVTLTASMRSNLLSLQNTQKLFDSTQERLSTGKKVNSALDNPTSFFTAQSLSKRADDLTGLLDTMGQAVQSLTAADQGLTTLTTLTEQAQSLVNSALDTTNTGSYLVGNSELNAYDDLSKIGGITAGNTITVRTGDATEMVSGITLTPDDALTFTADAAVFTLQDNNGNTIATATLDDTSGAGGDGDMTAAEAAQSIQDQLGYDSKGNNRANVSIVDGRMTITATDKNNALVASGTEANSVLGFDLGTTVAVPAAADLSNATALTGTATAAGTISFTYGGTAMTASVDAGTTAAGAAAVISEAIEQQTGAVVNISATEGGLKTDNGVSFTITASTATNLDAGAADAQQLEGISVKSFMDAINNGVPGVTASINDAGRLVMTSDAGEDLIIQDGAGTVSESLGIKGVSTNGSEQRATYASQFNDILVQINEIVGNDDTGYKGINLLNGDNLTVNFNETRTSTLTVEGVTMNTQGLGLTSVENDWTESAYIEDSLRQVEAALTEIEDVSSNFAQNLSIVQTRQDFTENMVNVLTTGADDLTLADMNEEAANMLALQTRQQLATNALSLSSQSAQSVLSLF